MAPAIPIIAAVIGAGAAVYSANESNKASRDALKHTKAREAQADASRTQEKKLPRAPVSGLDPSLIGGFGNQSSGALSGVLLGSGTPGGYTAPSTALLGGGP